LSKSRIDRAPKDVARVSLIYEIQLVKSRLRLISNNKVEPNMLVMPLAPKGWKEIL